MYRKHILNKSSLKKKLNIQMRIIVHQIDTKFDTL